MSVIAWDGKSIAADKQATSSGLREKTTKLRRIETGEVLAVVGEQDCGRALIAWYEKGAELGSWPAFQADEKLWTRLIVADSSGARVYERQPYAVPVEDPFMAWGSGRDYAMGAMARGATAREAVEIAMRFDNGCGLGIDEVTFA